MCGIHGVITAKLGYSKSICDFIRQAFVANSLRGMDSSGLFQIGNNSKSVFLHKDAVNGSAFIEQPATELIIRDADTTLATVCHVRAKTQGDVNKNNAHPFIGFADDGKRIIGVHNGSLTNWKHLPGGKDFEVDSAWAIQQIAEHGQQTFGKLQGAYSIVYWDEESPTKFNFVRNSQRPMHLLFSKDGKHMLFASEAGMLAWLAERVKFEHDGQVRELPVDKVFTFDTSGDKITWECAEVKRPTYTPPATNNNEYSISMYQPPALVRDLERWKKVLAGEVETTANEERPNVRPLCEVGSSCDVPFRGSYYPSYSTDVDQPWDEDGELDAIWNPSDWRGGDTPELPYKGDFRFPDHVIPPSRHLGATEVEIQAAKTDNVWGVYAEVEWDTFDSRKGVLYGAALCPDSGLHYDVAMREMSKRQAQKIMDSATSACIVGLEQDGTLIVRSLTKKMRALLSA